MTDCPISVSVVICCHNAVDRIATTLGYLERQRVPNGLRWEIVVVDNASTDGTAALVRQLQISHSDIRLKIVSEPRLGTATARWTGVEQSVCSAILFVDDDNWLSHTYVATVSSLLTSQPEVAAVGGISSGAFESVPPAWWPLYQQWYAVNDHTVSPGLLEIESTWTAGLAIRRDALLMARRLPLPLMTTGRQGQSLESAEDIELCLRLRLCGFRLFRCSELSFEHYMPSRRLTWRYLRQLNAASGRISVRLDPYRLNNHTSRSALLRVIQQSWTAQCINSLLRLAARGLLLPAAERERREGSSKVLEVERYLGRLQGLITERRSYTRNVRLFKAVLERRQAEPPYCYAHARSSSSTVVTDPGAKR